MTEEITIKISFDVLGSVLLLAFSSGVLQTNIGSALLMNHFSQLTNCHSIKLTYLCTITVYPKFHTHFNDSMSLNVKQSTFYQYLHNTQYTFLTYEATSFNV
jgi:hypothetical protein